MKDMRTRLGMTQAQLAEALGISTRTVATYEAGTEPPKAIRLACHWIEHEATACAPAPAGPDYGDYENELCARLSVAETDLGGVMKRLAAVERTARIALQRAQEACLAIDEAGVPIHQKIVPMTEEEAEEADLKLREARLLDLAAKPTPGALTDDERADVELARRMIAKARQIAQGEPWE